MGSELKLSCLKRRLYKKLVPYKLLLWLEKLGDFFKTV